MDQRVANIETKIAQLENAGHVWTTRVDDETQRFHDAVGVAIATMKAESDAQMSSLIGKFGAAFMHVKNESDNRAAQQAQQAQDVQNLVLQVNK